MSMEYRAVGALLVGLGLAGAAAAQTSATLVSVSAHGNFRAAGVVATISGDTDRDAVLSLAWRTGGGSFVAAHPLVRIGPTTFAGSLFWLAPGTAYEVRVTLADPDGVAGSPQAAAFSTRSEAFAEPTQRTLYVATTGSDAPGNLGTNLGSPLRTIQRAANLAQPGDLVSIAPGVYRESVDVPVSGTAAQPGIPEHPIVFRGSGPGVVLDGADGTIAGGVAWANLGGVYAITPGFTTGHVVTELGRLFRYDACADLGGLPAGPPGGFCLAGGELRVRFHPGSTASPSPMSHTMHVARLENGFVLDGRSFVRIEDLEIRHFGAGDYGKGVYLRQSSDCAVRRCRIHEVGSAGVWVKGGARHRIEDNTMWDTSIPGWVWDWTKGSSAENNAIVMTDDVGRGNVVRGNTVAGFFNGIAPCGGLEPPGGVTTTETDVYDNVLMSHNDDAFEPEGWCSNVRLWGNRIRDVHMAFAVAPASPGPTWIVRNTALDFGNTRSSQLDGWRASALKINSGYPEPVGPLLVYHNTFLSRAPGTDAVALFDPGESTWIRSRNNVIAGTDYALYKVNPVALDWNFDDLWTTHATRYVSWQGTTYATLADLVSGTGQEASGRRAAPMLVDPSAGNFAPQDASPLIDAGTPLPGIDDGYLGAAPDIGAVEWGGLFRDGFESGTRGAWSGAVP
jgi:hypothetical protein